MHRISKVQSLGKRTWALGGAGVLIAELAAISESQIRRARVLPVLQMRSSYEVMARGDVRWYFRAAAGGSAGPVPNAYKAACIWDIAQCCIKEYHLNKHHCLNFKLLADLPLSCRLSRG